MLTITILFSTIGGYLIGNISIEDIKRQNTRLLEQMTQLESQITNLNKQVAILESERTKLEAEKTRLLEQINTPILMIVYPKNGSIISKKTQIYGVYYDRNNDITEIRILMDNGIMEQVAFYEGLWNYTFDPSVITEGQHLIIILAKDMEGREFKIALEVNVQKSPISQVIPDICEYPNLEAAFMEIYYSDKYLDQEEKNYIKIVFDILNENGRINLYPKEIMIYAITWESYASHYDPAFFKETIIPLARSLKGETDIETALNVRSWVDSYLKYVDMSMWDCDIKMIYTIKEGDCFHRSLLMVAILRASGIPARCVLGFYNDLPDKGHAWVEFFYEKCWIPIDSTAALPITENGLVDLNERILDKVYYVTFIPKKIVWDPNKKYVSEIPQVVFVGEKYSVYYAEQLVKLAKNNETRNKAIQYILFFKSSRSWSDRQKYGRLAIENAILSIGNFSRVYFDYELTSVELPEENSIIILTSPSLHIGKPIPRSICYELDFQISDSIEMESRSWNYGISWLDQKWCNRNITTILVDVCTNDLKMLPPDDTDNLIKSILNIKDESKQILKKMISILLMLETGVINETKFIIPSMGTESWFSGVGVHHNSGYAFLPSFKACLNLDDWIIFFEITINQWFSNESRWIDFRYVKLIDSKGEQLIELTSDGYLKRCPSGIWAKLPQNISFRKEECFIIVTCDMYYGWDLIFG
ncbi:MAG: transglutaminase domain-containing protein [Nitrososphaeria archaeon]